VSGSPTIPGSLRLPLAPAQRLVHDPALRRDFSRIDPLDRTALPTLDGPALSSGSSRTVSDRLAGLLRRPVVLSFASGGLALRRTFAALLAGEDDVIVDAGADRVAFEAVLHAPARVHRSPPGSVEAMERRLARLSRSRRGGRIFVLAPAVARLSSVVADLAEISRLCRIYRAILIVDVTQDFGTMGHSGLGVAEMQGCLDRIDVMIGDLSVTCGVAGGFAAFRDPALCDPLIRAEGADLPLPESAAAILAVLDLMDRPEGRRRRRRLNGAAIRLHNHLAGDHLPVMGQPSPVVPVRLRPETARDLTALAASAGLMLPLVEAPEVAGRSPRWLIRLSAGHGPADIDDLAEVLGDVLRTSQRRALMTPA
jgi:glycine C-acetyltransferase